MPQQLISLLLIFSLLASFALCDDEDIFPWDIGDLTDDPVSEDEIFSQSKKYVSFI